ncbi:GNAT family N-acetyltransferase [Granulicoccus sp. GXG6511]|uniref:GNAT family N-acetyltransferase n=1 Tax=Granulicoccus sp. GXG6511 TaxID=3381351 RepID=UPI003D7E5A73
MLLRETRPEDLDGVIGLEESEDTCDWLGDTGRSWHENALADPDQWHLVFVKAHPSRDDEDRDGEELVGFVVLAGLAKPGPVEMRRMVVSAVQRGKGYGRQLLGEVFKLIDDVPDRDRIWLDVSPDNERAVALYDSVGFEPCEAPEGAPRNNGVVYMDYEL